MTWNNLENYGKTQPQGMAFPRTPPRLFPSAAVQRAQLTKAGWSAPTWGSGTQPSSADVLAAMGKPAGRTPASALSRLQQYGSAFSDAAPQIANAITANAQVPEVSQPLANIGTAPAMSYGSVAPVTASLGDSVWDPQAFDVPVKDLSIPALADTKTNVLGDWWGKAMGTKDSPGIVPVGLGILNALGSFGAARTGAKVARGQLDLQRQAFDFNKGVKEEELANYRARQARQRSYFDENKG